MSAINNNNMDVEVQPEEMNMQPMLPATNAEERAAEVACYRAHHPEASSAYATNRQRALITLASLNDAEYISVEHKACLKDMHEALPTGACAWCHNPKGEKWHVVCGKGCALACDQCALPGGKNFGVLFCGKGRAADPGLCGGCAAPLLAEPVHVPAYDSLVGSMGQAFTDLGETAIRDNATFESRARETEFKVRSLKDLHAEERRKNADLAEQNALLGAELAAARAGRSAAASASTTELTEEEAEARAEKNAAATATRQKRKAESDAYPELRAKLAATEALLESAAAAGGGVTHAEWVARMEEVKAEIEAEAVAEVAAKKARAAAKKAATLAAKAAAAAARAAGAAASSSEAMEEEAMEEE